MAGDARPFVRLNRGAILWAGDSLCETVAVFRDLYGNLWAMLEPTFNEWSAE